MKGRSLLKGCIKDKFNQNRFDGISIVEAAADVQMMKVGKAVLNLGGEGRRLAKNVALWCG